MYSQSDADTDARDAMNYAYAAGQRPNSSLQHSAIYFAVELDRGRTPVSDSAAAQYFTRLSADFASRSFVSRSLGFTEAANPYYIGIYASNSNLAIVQSLSLPNIKYYWKDTGLPNDPGSPNNTFDGANIRRDNNLKNYDRDTALTANDYGQWNVQPPGSWALDTSGSFSDPVNWGDGIVPGPTSNVTIDYPDRPQVRHETGSDSSTDPYKPIW